MSGAAAVILAAGRGLRLRPQTDAIPKALLPVAGRPILAHILAALQAGAGVRDVTVVVGYKAAEFVNAALPSGIDVRFVENPRWEETNSSASLQLAANELRGGGFIIEGDCCFDATLFNAPRTSAQAIWFARPFSTADDGCCLEADAYNVIQHLSIRNSGGPVSSNCWKSCGVLRLSENIGAQLAGWLDTAMQQGRAQQYYDLILAEHLKDAQFSVADIGAAPWCEVDNAADLARAEQLFGRAAQQQQQQ